MMSVITPLNIGVVADPATLVLSYRHVNKDVTKIRKRKMPLRDFSEKSDVIKFAFAVKQRHSEHLHDVHLVTIEKLLRIIQEILKGLDRSEAVAKVSEEYNIDPEEDLNKISARDLIRKKELMEEIYNRSLVKPDDPDFVYDKEVDFDQIKSTSQQNQQYTDWDDEDELSERDCQDKNLTVDVKSITNFDKENKLEEADTTGGSDRSRLYEVEDVDHSPVDSTQQYYFPLILSSKIENRNKSLFEKANPVKLDELDDTDIGFQDIEIECTEAIELNDEDVELGNIQLETADTVELNKGSQDIQKGLVEKSFLHDTRFRGIHANTSAKAAEFNKVGVELCDVLIKTAELGEINEVDVGLSHLQIKTVDKGELKQVEVGESDFKIKPVEKAELKEGVVKLPEIETKDVEKIKLIEGEARLTDVETKKAKLDESELHDVETKSVENTELNDSEVGLQDMQIEAAETDLDDDDFW